MMLRTTFTLALSLAVLTTAAGCSHLMMMAHGRNVSRPAPTEFSLGPRSSAAGQFVATLQPDQPLQVRRLQTVRVAVSDADGRPVDEAEIVVGGGMPQHGHGLPTRPRVTRELGDGLYEIAGVRFNMGGWWEFTLTITTASGSDTVTFNLDL
jgi:hypothetical protein